MSAKKSNAKQLKSLKTPGHVTRRTAGMAPTVDEDGYEIVGGQSQGLEIGETCEGVFHGIPRSMPSRRKGQPDVPFFLIGSRMLLGSTVLRNRIEEGQVQVGDYVKVTRLEDGSAKKGQNAAKIFDVRVKRAGAGKKGGRR